MKTIYCDGVFDLFHKGHLSHLKKIHTSFNEPIYLIVGLVNDQLAEEYKRKPIVDEKRRQSVLNSCKYIDKTILLDNLIITKAFMNKYNIDMIVHAFANKNDFEKQKKYYEVPIKLDKFKRLEYNQGISTTSIIKNQKLDWLDIWEKKGHIEDNDSMLLNGCESTNFSPEEFINHIVKILDIHKNNTILDMGCGCGLLSDYLRKYISLDNYIGIDASLSLVTKGLKLKNLNVLHFFSVDSIFKTNYFDFSICNGMVEYLNNKEELIKTLNELERVTKKGVYIGNIRKETHSEKKSKHIYDGVFQHLVIPPDFFIERGYTIIQSQLNTKERYDSYKIFDI